MQELRELLSTPALSGGVELEQVGLLPLATVLLVSLAAAMLVSLLYLRFYGGRETGSQIHRSFPLLGVSVTAIFITVQFSLPLSLGLLGALSIVRFRTPIKEPEEIGFLMVVIATSLACATFNLRFLLVLFGAVVLAILAAQLAFRFVGRDHSGGAVIVALSEGEYSTRGEELLQGLADRLPKGRLESVSKNGDDMVLTYSFRRVAPEVAVETHRQLSRLVEGADFTLVLDRGF